LHRAEGQEITNASSFMKIGAGAKAVSLGGAFVARADDASAGYWNPAGLAQLSRPVILLENRIQVMDTNHASIAFASPILGLGFFGISGIYYDCGDVITYDSNGISTGVLTNREAALILSYAYGLDKFSFGINGKYFYQKMQDNSESILSDGIGADFAVLYGLNEKFRLGATFNSQYDMVNSGNNNLSGSSPIKVRAGVYYRTGGDKEYLNLMLDFDQTRFQPLKLHLGAELVIHEIFALRTGLDNIYAEKPNPGIDHIDLVKENIKPTIGMGIKWKMGSGLRTRNILLLDYALSLEKLGTRNFITLAYQF